MSEQALLLINLGSPASPQVADVRHYLNQFLMDPYVLDMAWPLRRLLVSMILHKRPETSAEAYASIWTDEGSPLLVYSRALQARMVPFWPEGPVALAMRYGEPSIDKALVHLKQQGIRQLVVAPLYPQFADSTTTTVLTEVQRVMARRKLDFQLSVLAPFYDQPAYIQALVDSAQPYLAQGFDHLLLSYHGLPERHVRKSDPSGHHCLQQDDCCQRAEGAVLAHCYRAQCFRTSEAFTKAAGLTSAQWSMSFQSRLGRAKWIEPYTDERLEVLAEQGVKRLLVMCPAFVADCLETLEEIGIRAQEQFLAAGGESLQLIPCLNAHPSWVMVLAGLCRGIE